MKHVLSLFDKRHTKRWGIVALIALSVAACYGVLSPFRAQAAGCAVPAGDFGSVTSTVNITTAGTYRIWSRIMAPDANANSYLLEVDGNTCYTVGDSAVAAGAWTWVDYQNGTVSSKVQQSLSAGSHTIKLVGREAGVKLDKVLFVTDTTCVPTGLGDNCTTAATGDTEPPTVDITAPNANANITNTVNVTANADDNTAVTKVEFYVNGTLASTDTTSPYAYSWATTTVANGPASLMAKAYDAAGNTSSDSVQVTVANGDSQAPSKPTGVSAQANAFNKVTVAWSPSTDNAGVTGYWVSRNGTVLAKVTSGTQYVDTDVLPASTYSYRVSAVDAAGNTSSLSDEAKVTTPSVPDTQPPSAPTNVRAQAASATQLNLSWVASTDNTGVAGYEVYRGKGSATATRIATVTTLSFGDTGLSPSTAYTYYVIAKDRAGNASQRSTPVTATTQSKPPANTKTGAVKGTVKLDKRRPATATVTITTRGFKRIVSTNSAGHYAINDVPAGVYVVTYRAPGYHKEVRFVSIKANKTQTKNVTLHRR
jgi:chitodextrinase